MARSWTEAFDLGDGATSLPTHAEEETQRSGVFRRLRESLSKSRQALQAELSSSLFEQLDDETWERLEEALILADVGAKTTADVVGRLEHEVEAGAGAGAAAGCGRRLQVVAGGQPGVCPPARSGEHTSVPPAPPPLLYPLF